MRKTTWCIVFLAMFSPADVASALDLTAVTVFGCNDQGEVDIAFRTNSGPIDAAWDCFLYKGPVFDPASGDPNQIDWLSRPDTHTVTIPLEPGVHRFLRRTRRTRLNSSTAIWPRV